MLGNGGQVLEAGMRLGFIVLFIESQDLAKPPYVPNKNNKIRSTRQIKRSISAIHLLGDIFRCIQWFSMRVFDRFHYKIECINQISKKNLRGTVVSYMDPYIIVSSLNPNF